MGKAKKRILHKSNSSLFMTRERAVLQISKAVMANDKYEREKVERLVSLFGLSSEELSEAGVQYEYLKSLEGFMN